MSRPNLISSLARGAALALAGTLAISGTAAAGSTWGPHGHHEFPDYPGATCRYLNDWGTHYALRKIAVLPPSVWWPNTNAGKTDERGTVGWRAIIQKSTEVDGPWTVLKRTPIQKATAYEDQLEPYGSATKAPFSKQIVGWNATRHANSFARVVVKIFWYRADGSVITTKNRVLSYKVKFGSTATGSAYQFCASDVFYS